MSKLLSIIIPHYQESEKEVFPLLASINNQLGISFNDLEIIIVNDNGTPLTPNFFSQFFQLNISTLNLAENKGSGQVRQRGLDHATGKYILFCDADDMLHNVGVLGTFIEEISQHAPDILTSFWLEELFDGEKFCYLSHENENTWMHGKVFKKSFLDYYQISFHEHLRIHEDSYFLSIASSLTKNIRTIPITTYVWKWRNDSITRQENSSYTYKSIPTFHLAIGQSFEELEKRGVLDTMSYRVVQMTIYTYLNFQQEYWYTENTREYLKIAETSFQENFKSYINKYFDKSLVMDIYKEERNKKDVMEKELFYDWLQRMFSTKE